MENEKLKKYIIKFYCLFHWFFLFSLLTFSKVGKVFRLWLHPKNLTCTFCDNTNFVIVNCIRQHILQVLLFLPLIFYFWKDFNQAFYKLIPDCQLGIIYSWLSLICTLKYANLSIVAELLMVQWTKHSIEKCARDCSSNLNAGVKDKTDLDEMWLFFNVNTFRH